MLKQSAWKCSLWFQQIKAIVDTGVNCIVTGGKVAEMALHFCNKFNILVVRLVYLFLNLFLLKLFLNWNFLVQDSCMLNSRWLEILWYHIEIAFSQVNFKVWLEETLSVCWCNNTSEVCEYPISAIWLLIYCFIEHLD